MEGIFEGRTNIKDWDCVEKGTMRLLNRSKVKKTRKE